MTRLIWADKQPRFAWEQLTLPIQQGGLCAPDMELYFYCAQAKFSYYWFHLVAFMPQLAVEGDCLFPVPLQVAICGEPTRQTGDVQPS